ncbi:MAG TPA: tetratricopeptide repeat protein [Thermoanaerobaculia bacterium]|nr:tetratricopeptide repeat protein [Thermoanaerobaculia bacterium]
MPTRTVLSVLFVLSVLSVLSCNKEKPAQPSPAREHAARGAALIAKAQADPTNPSAGDWLAEAQTALQKAVELDPQGATDARKNLEQIAKMTTPPPATPPPAEPTPAPATGTVDAAAVRNAQMGEIFKRGLAALNSGDKAGAVKVFQEAVELDPEALDARMYLGIALVQARRNPEAVTQFEIAKKIDPVKANEYITKGLHLQPDEHNLQLVIDSLKMN